MDFPKNEVQTLLAWMREQMYGDTVTEWAYGNEHDRMSEAADFLNGLLSGDISTQKYRSKVRSKILFSKKHAYALLCTFYVRLHPAIFRATAFEIWNPPVTAYGGASPLAKGGRATKWRGDSVSGFVHFKCCCPAATIFYVT